MGSVVLNNAEDLAHLNVIGGANAAINSAERVSIGWPALSQRFMAQRAFTPPWLQPLSACGLMSTG